MVALGDDVQKLVIGCRTFSQEWFAGGEPIVLIIVNSLQLAVTCSAMLVSGEVPPLKEAYTEAQAWKKNPRACWQKRNASYASLAGSNAEWGFSYGAQNGSEGPILFAICAF